MEKISKLLTVDPASYQTGVAYFEDGQLLFVRVLRGSSARKEIIDYTDEAVKRAGSIAQQMHEVSAQLGLKAGEFELAVEYPRIYPGTRDEDPNSMIDISLVIGRLLENIPEPLKAHFPFPGQWKSQVKKKHMVKHIISFLSKNEIEAMGKDVKNHNAVDAVGIGLWKLRRMVLGGG